MKYAIPKYDAAGNFVCNAMVTRPVAVDMLVTDIMQISAEKDAGLAEAAVRSQAEKAVDCFEDFRGVKVPPGTTQDTLFREAVGNWLEDLAAEGRPLPQWAGLSAGDTPV